MKTISSLTLKDGSNNLQVNEGAVVLGISNEMDEDGYIMINILHETNRPPQTRNFNVFHSGEPLEDFPGRYVGSVGTVHVFEK